MVSKRLEQLSSALLVELYGLAYAVRILMNFLPTLHIDLE